MEEIMRYAYENGGISPHRRLERAIRESAALVCLTMATIHAPKGKKFKLEDFMPKAERALSAEDELPAVEKLLSSLGGGVASGRSGTSGIKWKRKASARG